MDENTNLRAIVDVHDGSASILGLYENYSDAYKAYALFRKYYVHNEEGHELYISDYSANVADSEAALEHFDYDCQITNNPYWKAIVSSYGGELQVVDCTMLSPYEIGKMINSDAELINPECDIIESEFDGFYKLLWFRAETKASARNSAVNMVRDYIRKKNGDAERDLKRFESYVADHIYVANAMDMVEKLSRYSNVGYMADEKHLIEWKTPIRCTEVELTKSPADGGYWMRILRFPGSVKLLDDKGGVIASLDFTKKEG